MATEYINQEATIKMFHKAEALAFEAFNRILTENNTMRKQLAAIGKKPGDKMDDVIKLPVFENNEFLKLVRTLPAPWWEPQSKVVEIDKVEEEAE